MGIWIGNNKVTEHFYAGNVNTTGVWIGSFKTYPDDVYTYSLTNAWTVYSSSDVLYANQSNYATIHGTFKTYRNGVEISSEEVICDGINIISDNHISIYDSNKLHWNKTDYGMTELTGSTSYVTVTYHGYSYSNNVGVKYGSNSRTYHEQVTGFTAPTISSIYSYTGTSDTGVMYGVRNYDNWYTYSSGDETTHGHMIDAVVPDSFTNYPNWISSPQKGHLSINRNSEEYPGTGTEYREGTVTANYQGFSDDFTIKQYKAPHTVSEYRVNSASVSPTIIEGWGTSHYATVTVTCQYRSTTWEDGHTVDVPWTNYTGAGDIMNIYAQPVSGGFGSLDANGGNQQAAYYPQPFIFNSDGEGKIRVYPTSENTTYDDKECSIFYKFYTVTGNLTVYQKGKPQKQTCEISGSASGSQASASLSIANTSRLSVSYQISGPTQSGTAYSSGTTYIPVGSRTYTLTNSLPSGWYAITGCTITSISPTEDDNMKYEIKT